MTDPLVENARQARALLEDMARASQQAQAMFTPPLLPPRPSAPPPPPPTTGAQSDVVLGALTKAMLLMLPSKQEIVDAIYRGVKDAILEAKDD